jgi:hypothetical protein
MIPPLACQITYVARKQAVNASVRVNFLCVIDVAYSGVLCARLTSSCVGSFISYTRPAMCVWENSEKRSIRCERDLARPVGFFADSSRGAFADAVFALYVCIDYGW